ncbi:MAG: hypothetical protein J0M04_15470 [Verrucomicrobia bacterium]|nr:hypothetical protein [Verrucomicrobiota bacterium]
MKAALLAIFGIIIVAIIGVAAWSEYGYSIVCTKCLATKHATEQRFFGLTIRTTVSPIGGGQNYEGVFGRPCDHVFHRGGWGTMHLGFISCGKTREGLLYEPRDSAVAMAFRATKLYHDDELTKRTFAMIDRLAPPDGTTPSNDSEAGRTREVTLRLLGHFLGRANSSEDWRLILQAAENSFEDTTGLPDAPSP